MIYLFLAEGFEEIEALAVVDILRRAQLAVQTVGVGGRQITGSHNITVLADTTEDEINPDETETVILPGGMPGTANLEKSAVVKRAVQAAMQKENTVGAICAAPSILGKMGYLAGRAYTCYPGYEQGIEGADYTGKSVVTDGNMITAKGAGRAVDFALALVAKLAGEKKADEIRRSIQC